MRLRILLSVTAIFVVLTCVTSCSRRDASRELTHSQIAGPPALKANANELKSTIVTPYLEQKIVPGKNVLWCDTFQLAWNELCDLIGAPVQMQPPSPMADILNKRTATKADIDDASYVAMAGLIDDGIEQKIQDELQRKFSGQASPELLDFGGAAGWATYAYLFKSLPFETAFERLHDNLEFGGQKVDSFGIPIWGVPATLVTKRASQVTILYYRQDGGRRQSDEFVVELKTLARDDRLILAKIAPKQNMINAIRDVLERVATQQPTELSSGERLLVPVVDFHLIADYNQLLGRVVKNEPVKTGLPLVVARQLVRFRMDETGAVVQSEAMMVPGSPPPRAFIFNKPFLILLQHKDARNPYFALWVDNAELLVSTAAPR